MTEQHNSSQLVLEPEQYEALEQLARKQNRPISDVARQVVRLEQMRQEIYRTHGMYLGDPVAEVRAEREKQIDRVMRGEP